MLKCKYRGKQEMEVAISLVTVTRRGRNNAPKSALQPHTGLKMYAELTGTETVRS